MAVRLRFKRFGRRHHPTYRLAAIERRRAVNGKVLEELGLYDPMNKDPEKQVTLNRERIEYWLGVGATPSDTVQNLLAKNGYAVKPVVRLSKPKKEVVKEETPEGDDAAKASEDGDTAKAPEGGEAAESSTEESAKES